MQSGHKVIVMRRSVQSKSEQERAGGIGFCQLFEQEMDRLYTLALLLTADHKLAEECFADALADCWSTASSVFQPWTLMCSKRAVIKNAIRALAPTAKEKGKTVSLVRLESPLAQAVLELDLFSRFVFVISVLEGNNDWQCALLLDCTPQDVTNARSGAFLQLAKAAGPRAAAILVQPNDTYENLGDGWQLR